MNVQFVARLLSVAFLVIILVAGGCSREESGPGVPSSAPTPLPTTPAVPLSPPAQPPAARQPVPVETTAQAAPVEGVSLSGSTRNAVDKPSKGILLHEPLLLQRVEFPAETLAVWRQHAQERPTLLLLSNDPMLFPVPAAVRAEALQVAAAGSADLIRKRNVPYLPDPLLYPEMTVDVALRSGWFGQVVWVMPFRGTEQGLPVEAWRKKLVESGVASEQELATWTFDSNAIRGEVHEIPLVATALPNLGVLSGPVVVHIDPSYFQGQYKNEIATPLLDLHFEALRALRDRRIPVLAVTFNYGNVEGRIALDVRFLGEVLAHYLEQPGSFDKPLRVNWRRQEEILYLKNFFEEDRMVQVAAAMEKTEPRSAWVQFTRFRVAAANIDGKQALEYLAKAVRRDRVYALEYLSLANMAYDKKRPDAALNMLKNASKAFPDNPHIRLKIAQLSAELGDRKTALHLVEQLQPLPWSTVYYPQMPDYLKGFADFLQQEPPPRPSAPQPAQASPARPTAEHNGSSLPAGHPGVMPPGHP